MSEPNQSNISIQKSAEGTAELLIVAEDGTRVHIPWNEGNWRAWQKAVLPKFPPEWVDHICKEFLRINPQFLQKSAPATMPEVHLHPTFNITTPAVTLEPLIRATLEPGPPHVKRVVRDKKTGLVNAIVEEPA